MMLRASAADRGIFFSCLRSLAMVFRYFEPLAWRCLMMSLGLGAKLRRGGVEVPETAPTGSEEDHVDGVTGWKSKGELHDGAVASVESAPHGEA
ncbi:unnamed protein product, partial [Ixodes pacificus]